MLLTLLATALVLGILIFVHELGHFLAAKAAGVGVERFSFGLGPKVLGIKFGDTEYRLSAIPLGGYVKMVGEAPGEEVPPELAPRSFTEKSVSKRACIVLAGPLGNFLFAFLVFFLVFWAMGLPTLSTEIGEVMKDMPAYQAGLRPGDRIRTLDGTPVKRWEEMAGRIRKSQGSPVTLTLEREGKPYQVRITPVFKTAQNLFGEEVQVPAIGVSPAKKILTEFIGPIEALVVGVQKTADVTKLTVLSLVKLIQRKIPLKTLGGPIFIAQLAGQQAQEGVVSLLFFAALISVNLAILNLLPIPILDGGHLIFFLIEAVLRRPLSLKMRETAQQVGMTLLILLTIFIFYNDLARIFLAP
jgi:regulator of sigma E protease